MGLVIIFLDVHPRQIVVKRILIATTFQVGEKRTIRITIMSLSMNTLKNSNHMPVEINRSNFINTSTSNQIIYYCILKLQIILLIIPNNEVINM